MKDSKCCSILGERCSFVARVSDFRPVKLSWQETWFKLPKFKFAIECGILSKVLGTANSEQMRNACKHLATKQDIGGF